ncbi:hypothetical protein R1flu_027829 [Riccia fluitans]|uniref:RING-CH-type domain-containing protein n=1 Tax=Riccia fluitans TaxID=41844 RepID=A0ABD1XMS4_9MARC
MEVSEAGIQNSEMQPPASSSSSINNFSGDGGGSSKGIDVHFVRTSSQEIESVVNGAAGDGRSVDRDLDEAVEEKMSTQQSYDDPSPSSSGGTDLPRVIPQGEETSSVSSNVKKMEQVEGSAGSGGTIDSVPNGGIPSSDNVVDVGSIPVYISDQGMANTAAAIAAAGADEMKKGDNHVIDIPVKDSVKVQELDGYKGFGIPRTMSNFSVGSAGGDLCRICQQHSEEPVMELGCHCRGELAKAHRSCIEQWFGNKGTNKCEVCQHVATNVPAPSSQPTPHFWVWRVGGNYNGVGQRRGGARFHPLWAALLILIAGLLFDVLISIFLGASALPVNIIIGVLVVLGLGTAARLILECWHERVIRRNIRMMEEEPSLEDLSVVDQTTLNNLSPPEQSTANSAMSQQSPGIQGAEGVAQLAARASNSVGVFT